MKYVRCPSGDRLHMLVDGRALCGVPNAVETDEQPSSSALPCENCDNELRSRGRAKAPKRKARPVVVFVPRFTFEDWERERPRSLRPRFIVSPRRIAEDQGAP